MNKQVFENSLLPQDFSIFEENFSKWESFLEKEKEAISKLAPEVPPISEKDLKIALQQLIFLTKSFNKGKTIAEAMAFCEKQFDCQSDDDFDEELLRKVTKQNTEKIRTNSINDSEKPRFPENLPVISQQSPEPSTKKQVRLKPIEIAQCKPTLRPESLCSECLETEASKLKNAVNLLCNPTGGGGWVLNFSSKRFQGSLK